jgi:hypothetical protein
VRTVAMALVTRPLMADCLGKGVPLRAALASRRDWKTAVLAGSRSLWSLVYLPVYLCGRSGAILIAFGH